MFRRLPLLILALVLTVAACDSSTPSIPTTAPGSTTSTTIEDDTCARLAQDTAKYLETVVEVLDIVTLDELRDREAWPEALIALEQQGEDLDIRSDAMRCDRAEVQATAFRIARLDPDSDLARYLLDLFEAG